MKAEAKKYVIALICCMLCCMAHGAGAKVSDVKHLLLSDGLSSQRVFSILEGKHGEVWLSTRAGVDRYNGREITNFQLKGDFYSGDLAGRVIQLARDADGNIIAYDNLGYIYRFSSPMRRFELMYKLLDQSNQPVHLNKYIKDADGTEYYCLTQGLYRKGAEGLEPLLSGKNVNDMVIIGDSIYAATSMGLDRMSKKEPGYVKNDMPTSNIQSLFSLGDKPLLYIGTFNDGLWRMDLATSSINKVITNDVAFNNPIRVMTRLSDDELGVGIDGGGVFGVGIRNGGARMLIDTSDSQDYSLQGNGVYALTLDRWGNAWVGSYTGGASYVMFSHSPLRHVTHQRGNPNSLGDNNVNGISEGANGCIWYATDRGVSISCGNGWSHALGDYVCLTICPMAGGDMMIGTYGEGVFVLDRDGNLKRRFSKQDGTLTSNYIFALQRDNDDYWVGALDGDLIRIDANGARLGTYPVRLVNALVAMGAGKMAATTVDGFYVVDKATGKAEHYASSVEQVNNGVSAYIVPMLNNGDGTVWLGTEGGGLTLYNMNTRKPVKTYTMAQGLPSNDVYGLQRDALDRLWISTGNGISLLADTVLSSLNYLKGVDAEYNKASSARLRNGDIAFGSTSGALRFTPSDIGVLYYQAPLRLIGFSIEGLDQNTAEADKLNLYSDLHNGKMELNHDQNSFTIDFECVNLRYQDDIGYRYILEGYDQDWSASGTTGKAEYKRVMPGNYTFKVCAIKLCDGSIIDSQELKITISRPWWTAWWAWIAYMLLAVLIMYLIFRIKMTAMQKRQDEDKIKFFINTAHDIRTPVTLALAPLDDLKREEELTDNGKYLLGLARQNIRKLSAITTQLLDFEKLEWDKKGLEMVPVDMNDLLRGEHACFSAACQKKGVDLQLKLPDETLCVMGVVDLLETIFDNLISNACKYTRPGGKVTIGLSECNGKVAVSISDTGIGIPKTAKKHIFTDIYRASNARESQEMGTGFGLLQVRRVVKALRGTIEYTSVEGEGTTFTVSFARTHAKADNEPRTDRASAFVSEITTNAYGVPAESNGENDTTVLIVEDNDDLRAYLGKIFLRDYNTVLMPTADEALVYLETGYPDLIISDVMMPGMPGDEFCRVVKEHPETSGIPVILLTAKTSREAEAEGLRHGADDYIPKPFSSEILKLKVKGLLENRNRLRNYLLRHAIVQAVSEPAVQPEATEAETGSPASVSDNAFVQKVAGIVLDNIRDVDFSIDSLCREMAMSRTLFYNRLKSLTGKAPQEFVRLLKLEKAAEMLKAGMTVNDVAEAAGFVNVKYFSTVFKKHFGVQPSKYGSE